MTTLPRFIRFFSVIVPGILATAAALAEGLTAQANGTIYDANQDVTWLADADFVISPDGRAVAKAAGITGIAPSGIMDYPSALRFVQAMNTIPCQGRGYLCHNNWQLPVMVTVPAHDPTCTVHRGFDGNSFGPNCRQSAFGMLFYRGLGLRYPSSVAPRLQNSVAGFVNLHPALYWSATEGDRTGQRTFSFLTGQSGSNTTDLNLLHVLAMHRGLIPGGQLQGVSTGISKYSVGPAANAAVYDAVSGISWLRDANLAATHAFGVTGNITIARKPVHDMATMPAIATGGAMHFQAISAWLRGLNEINYAGTNSWVLPELSDLETLYAHMALVPGEAAFGVSGSTGPFRNFQPSFYWACAASLVDPKQCDYGRVLNVRNNVAMRWCFNFDTGFQGTAQETKQYYVTLYHAGR